MMRQLSNWQNYLIGAFNHFFLPNARNCGYARMKDLGCTMDSQGIVVMCEWKILFRMRVRLARNCGYAGMGDVECAVDYHVLSSYTDFQLQFE